MTDDDLLEQLAALEHEQWAHWTGYLVRCLTPLFEQVVESDDPLVEDAFRMLRRWRRQIETPYDQLTELEKDSDREWAQKVLDLIKREKRLKRHNPLRSPTGRLRVPLHGPAGE